VGLGLRAETGEVPPDVIALADQRDAARAARAWAEADALRDRLIAAGWVVEDTPEGTKVRRG
jgi:cysteinyl-tRNA synthetase